MLRSKLPAVTCYYLRKMAEKILAVLYSGILILSLNNRFYFGHFWKKNTFKEMLPIHLNHLVSQRSAKIGRRQLCETPSTDSFWRIVTGFSISCEKRSQHVGLSLLLYPFEKYQGDGLHHSRTVHTQTGKLLFCCIFQNQQLFTS